MSDNKWLKRAAAFSTALLMLLPCAGCSGNNGSSDAGQNGSSVSGKADNEKQAVNLTEEQKKAAEEAGISEERYCTDNSAVTKIAEDLLNQYCEGMTNADHDKCFGAFPEFYKKAVEEENKSYGDSNEQFMQSIKQNFVDSYGEDFYIFTTVNSVLQLSDESLENTDKRLKKSFGDDIVLEDLYYVYFTENVRGSQNKSSDSMEFYILVIDGKSYLYDDYYEAYDEEDASAAENEMADLAEQAEAAETKAEEKVTE